MALKTFNLNEEIYKEFSEYCKKNGISMSKKVENFIRGELESLKKGTRVFRKSFVKTVKSDRKEEHSFMKYC